ncbi:MAG: MFS transporter [Acidimicrobiales bacterium]|nr:MFS transporter [Acidimicrobiales bacterium]
MTAAQSSLLGDRSVRAYLTSSALAGTGISLMLAVLFKQAFDLTGDALTIGIIGLLQFVPAVVLVIISGYIADRFDRRRVAALMTVGRVACALAFFAYSRGVGDDVDVAIWPLYLITLAFGSIDAIAIPARHALAPLVVPRVQLPRLVAAGAVTRVVAAIVGPVTAGFLLTVGADVAYLVAAVVFALSAPPLLRIVYAVEQTKITDRPSVKLALEGLRFIRRSPVVLSAISLDMIAVLFGGAVALIPVIAEERLGVGDVAYGWLRAAPGIGAGITGLALARRPVTRRVGPTLLAVVVIFGAFHVVLGVATNYAVAFVALIIAAGADMVSMTIRSTLVPVATPDTQLGRVTAVESVFIGASNELGAFESGVAARYLGVPWAVAGGGLATVAIALGFAAFVPSLRRIDTYDDVTVEQPV